MHLSPLRSCKVIQNMCCNTTSPINSISLDTIQQLMCNNIFSRKQYTISKMKLQCQKDVEYYIAKYLKILMLIKISYHFIHYSSWLQTNLFQSTINFNVIMLVWNSTCNHKKGNWQRSIKLSILTWVFLSIKCHWIWKRISRIVKPSEKAVKKQYEGYANQ